MIKDATKQIIRRTLQSSFDKEQFLNFTKNLLNHINEDKAFHAHGYVKEQFKKTANIIKTYERLGTYTDPNEKKIDILVVYLAKDHSIDRARTSLRNFVADYLKGRDQKDAALVAFVSPSQDDWRFSLIKMEYKFEESKNGKMKVKEEFTPARRWSFLVGSKESSHTAQSRLAPILEDDERDLTLEQLEDAFNIEKVTKEFFEKYRDLFLGLKDNLDEMVKNDSKIKADFAEKDVDTVDFAKKLLGQIVFLYFLQKKGWFGVERDADWGTGPKDFLRQLYNKKHSEYKNFFNEILEPMFYEALARERDDDYYGRFNCKIPFLNGGLFDPIGNYDWVHTDINLDNELFSNSRPTKQGDIGDGILDVFDRYNFTVREDEPLEKEVAVDPEMLGKVFENLLEVKDRKSKGTYYTPREIVHYMCEQSLINYLSTEIPEVDKNDLEEFIKIGDQVLENEYWVTQKGDDNGSKIPASIKKNAETIDQKLAEIKVCDPAIGSGAFPVGMMGEIVNARLALNPFLCLSGLDPDSSSLECSGRTAYDFKMQAITDSIYGVDIDPGAVEIAKLRLWLSLVVDENDIKQIKPLPNLDYKIMQGNSLLEEFEGIKLFDESIIPQEHADRESQISKANEKINELQREFIKQYSSHELSKSQEQLIKQQIKDQQKLIQNLQEKPKQGSTVDLFNRIDEIKAKWDELTGLHKKIVNESNRQEKKKMIDRASELEWEFIGASLRKEVKIASLNKIEKYKKLNTKPFFLWHLHFANVFKDRGGFDVVIANPPYFQLQKNNKVSQELSNQGYVTYSKSSDIYCIFYERGINLLRTRGTLSYISSDSWMKTKYGELLRKYIKENTNPLILIDFENSQIFDSAVVESNVIVLEKNIYQGNLRALNFCFDSSQYSDITSYFNDNYVTLDSLNDSGWIISSSEVSLLRAKLEKDSTPLKQLKQHIYIGIINGFNEAFIINSQTRDRLIEEDARSTEIIKPLLRGRDVGRYYYVWHNLWLINTHNGLRGELPRINVEKDYPAIYKYLLRYQDKLEIRLNKGSHWTNLRNCAYFQELEKPKIIWGELSDKPKFAFDDEGFLPEATLFAMTGDNLKYLLGILNSKIGLWYFEQISTSSGMGTSRWKKYKIELFPIKDTDQTDKEEVSRIVDQIIALTKSDDYLTNPASQAKVHEYEHQVDKMVYKLYDLTPDEIKTIETN